MQELIGSQVLHAWDDTRRQASLKERFLDASLTHRTFCVLPLPDFPVRYTTSVQRETTIPRCDVAHELTSRTHGEKKWLVIVPVFTHLLKLAKSSARLSRSFSRVVPNTPGKKPVMHERIKAKLRENFLALEAPVCPEAMLPTITVALSFQEMN